MIRRATALLALLAPTPALACPAIDPVLLFHEAAASPRDFVILYGDMGTGPLRADSEPAPAFIAAVLAHMLTPGGFTAPFEAVSMQVRHVCQDGACGELASGEDVLIFAHLSEDGPFAGTYVAEVGPCGRWVQPNPSRAELDALVLCARGACPY